MTEKPDYKQEQTNSSTERQDDDVLQAISEIVKGSIDIPSILDSQSSQENVMKRLLEQASQKEAKFIKLYDEAFKYLMGPIPEDQKEAKGETAIKMSEIKQYRNKKVLWARIIGESIRTIEDRRGKTGVIAIVPPGHRVLPIEGPIVELESRIPTNLMLIRPYEITGTWAGLMMTWGIAALKYRAEHNLGPDNNNFKTNAEITEAAKRAATHRIIEGIAMLAGDSFFQFIAEICHHSGFKSMDDAVSWLFRGDNNRGLYMQANKLIREVEPKSEMEAQLRSHFYAKTFLKMSAGMLHHKRGLDYVNREFEKAVTRGLQTTDYARKIIGNQI